MIRRRVLMSSNGDPLYADFWPLVCKAWVKLGFDPWLAYVSAGDIPERIRTLGTVLHVPPMVGIPSGHLAKLSRMVIASTLPGWTMLSDVDMLPLKAAYFDDAWARYREGTLLSLSADAYDTDVHHPICYLLSDQRTWQAVVNPRGYDPVELVKSWRCNMAPKANPYRVPFSDEVLLALLLAGGKCIDRVVSMPRWGDDGFARKRIGRNDWKYDAEDLAAGRYIDSHMVRPLREYVEAIRPLADSLGLTGWEPDGGQR